MIFELVEPLAAARAQMTCAQIAIVLSAAGRVDHPVARLVELTILAPGIAPWVASCPVDMFDSKLGVVALPTDKGGWSDVALGGRAKEVAKGLVSGRSQGFLIEDDHGSPLAFDDDTSAFAVELLGRMDRRCSAYDWSLDALRVSALHRSSEDVADDVLLASMGLLPPGWPPRAAYHAQVWAADRWSLLLDLRCADVVAFGFMAKLAGVGIDPTFASWAMLERRP